MTSPKHTPAGCDWASVGFRTLMMNKSYSFLSAKNEACKLSEVPRVKKLTDISVSTKLNNQIVPVHNSSVPCQKSHSHSNIQCFGTRDWRITEKKKKKQIHMYIKQLCFKKFHTPKLPRIKRRKVNLHMWFLLLY